MTEALFIAPTGVVLALGFLYLRRLTQQRAVTFWILAWGCLYASGLASVVPLPPLLGALGFLPGSLFPALLFAGAVDFAGRRVPRWVVPAGLAIGGLRMGLAAVGKHEAAMVVAVPLELPFALGAAGLVWWDARSRPASFPQQLLGPGLAAIAGLNAGDPLIRMLDLPRAPVIVAWASTAIGVALLQVGAVLERVRERENALLGRLELLRRIARSAGRTGAGEHDLDGAVEAVRRAAELDAFGLWLRAACSPAYRCVAARGGLRGLPEELGRIPLEHPVVEALHGREEPLFTTLDTLLEPHLAEGALPHRPREEPASCVVAPLVGSEGIVGLAIGAIDPPRRFGPDDPELFADIAKEFGLVASQLLAAEENERRRRALEEERRRLHAVIEAAPMGIALVDSQERFLIVNSEALEHMGVEGTPTEWTGKGGAALLESIRAGLREGDRARLDRLVDRVLRDPDAEVEGVRLRVGQPIPRDIELNALPVFAEDGTRVGRLWVSREVTPERRMRDGLHGALRLEAIDALLPGIAHDLGEQLTRVLGATDALASEIGSTRGAGPGGLGELREAAERCGQIARGLRELARGRGAGMEAVELEGLLEHVAALGRCGLPADVELHVAVAPGTRPVRADRIRLVHVLANLIANARDAIEGPGRIDIEAENAPPRAGTEQSREAWVEIRVRDTGRGMDEATRSHLFEPFFTTKSPHAHTGLGLATVAQIVEEHGATIAVASELGRGSTFRLFWPAAQAARGQEASSRPGRATAREPHGTWTVLLAEDEPAVNRLVCGTLERAGYRVFEAPDAEGALRLFEKKGASVDLALVDLVMPGRDGLALIAELRRRRPGLPVVLMTGRPLDVEPAGLRVLQKPFAPRALLRAVEAALRAASHAARESSSPLPSSRPPYEEGNKPV